MDSELSTWMKKPLTKGQKIVFPLIILAVISLTWFTKPDYEEIVIKQLQSDLGDFQTPMQITDSDVFDGLQTHPAYTVKIVQGTLEYKGEQYHISAELKRFDDDPWFLSYCEGCPQKGNK